jgi:hypothetical protein
MKSYGTLLLTESSPPQSFCEPLSLAQVREVLKLPESSPPNAEEDEHLERLIISAREIAEGQQRRNLTQKQCDLWLDYFPCEIELRRPLTSVDLIRYRDSDGNYTDLTENTDYIVDTVRGLVMPAYGTSWPSFTPWPSSAVLIRHSGGYPENHPFWSNDGQRILTGMLKLITHHFVNALPFELSNLKVQEWPYGVRDLLSYGADVSVR